LALQSAQEPLQAKPQLELLHEAELLAGLGQVFPQLPQ
jgi:hypothetical protein